MTYREDVIDGKCVVIGLQSTGEARTAEQFEKEGEPVDFISTAKYVHVHFVFHEFTKFRFYNIFREVLQNFWRNNFHMEKSALHQPPGAILD